MPKKETWKPIPGLKDYEASNLGRVRRVTINILTPRKNYVTLREPQYFQVHIYNKRFLVHRLVALAFWGEIPKGKIVHHRDHNKENNALDNLQLATLSDNTRWAYEDGRIGSHYKLNPFQREKVVELYKSGYYSTTSLGKQFGVSKDTIGYLLKRAGIKPNGMKKLTPALIKQIRSDYARNVVSARCLAREYNLSAATVEYVLGMRASRGKWMPKIGAAELRVDPVGSGRFRERQVNHPQELVQIGKGK